MHLIIIEFVTDSDHAANYFWHNDNGLVLNGNYNNYPLLNGEIVRVEKVLEEKREDIVTYKIMSEVQENEDIFNYASGY